MKRLRIFFDGGARPNPGRIEVAAVVRGVAYVDREAGVGDNEAAEWMGLIHAARVAVELGLSDVAFLGDSLSVVRQVRDAGACGSARQREFRAAFVEVTAGMERVTVGHVSRSKNLAGFELARAHPR